jgi:hypothetical protein
MTARKPVTLASLLAVVVLFCGLGTAVGFESADEIPKSQSPNRSLTLCIVAGDLCGLWKLDLMPLSGSIPFDHKTPLAKLALSKTVSQLIGGSHTTTILWKQDSTGVAVSFSDKLRSAIFACVTVKGGGFKWIDLGVAEGPNLGMLGRERSDFTRIEDTPMRWKNADAWSPDMVWVRSRFWDKKGERYTVQQEFSISPTGEIGHK